MCGEFEEVFCVEIFCEPHFVVGVKKLAEKTALKCVLEFDQYLVIEKDKVKPNSKFSKRMLLLCRYRSTVYIMLYGH